MSKDVLLRNLKIDDLPAVSAIHIAAFPDSALTKLGGEVVRRYYQWQLLGPHEVNASGAFIDGKCAGFCFGGVFRGATSGFLRQNRMFLIGRVLAHPRLLRDRMFRDRLNSGVRILSRRTMPKSQTSQPGKRGKSFGILSIAVNPQCQGLGIGKLLMKEAEEVARQRGFPKMDLTVSPDNHQAIRFYEGLYWKRFSNNGIWTGAMIKLLNF